MTPCGQVSWQGSVLLSTLLAGSLSINKNAIFRLHYKIKTLDRIKGGWSFLTSSKAIFIFDTGVSNHSFSRDGFFFLPTREELGIVSPKLAKELSNGKLHCLKWMKGSYIMVYKCFKILMGCAALHYQWPLGHNCLRFLWNNIGCCLTSYMIFCCCFFRPLTLKRHGKLQQAKRLFLPHSKYIKIVLIFLFTLELSFQSIFCHEIQLTATDANKSSKQIPFICFLSLFPSFFHCSLLSFEMEFIFQSPIYMDEKIDPRFKGMCLKVCA